ncbi:Guanine nucleotide exchange factor N-terminal, partial [Trinorchestia longiramus]
MSGVIERMVAEDRERETCDADGGYDGGCDGKGFDVEELKVLKPTPPKTLAPAAADAFLLVQDLVQLVNADQPLWLVGLTEMTRTFGLDLLESVLTMFPRIFFQHPEFGYLLKERVCALVIQLFSPNIKYRATHAGGSTGAVSHSSPSVLYDKPYFPITLRLLRLVAALIHHYYSLLVTQCEIFLSLLVKFLECSERPEWQRCLALEVLHNLTTQPHLLLQFTRHYDCRPHSTNIFQDIVNSLGAFVQSLFLAGGSSAGSSSAGGGGSSSATTTAHTQGPGVVVSSHSPSLLAGLPVGPGVSATPAFCYRGVYLPLVASLALTSQPKPVYLQLVDKLEPPVIPEGYCVTLACLCLLETTRSIQRLLLQRQERLERESTTTESLSTSDLDTVPVKLSASEESPASTPADDDAASTNQSCLQEQVQTVPLDEEVDVALSDGPDTPERDARPAQQQSVAAHLRDRSASGGSTVKAATRGDSVTASPAGGVSSGPAEEEVLSQLVTSAWCGLLAALSTLLEACTEEAATESILQAFQSMAWVSGTLGLSTPRDAFITALCKSCLPPHYTLTVLNTPQSSPGSGGSPAPSAGSITKPQQHIHQSYHDAEIRQQVVAVGSALPTSATPSGAQQGPVMLTNKNLQ